jgi:hypothetical protein
MAYQVVELVVDGADQIVDRRVIPYPYQSRHEAVETIEGIIRGFDSSGYDPKAGYWWALAANGERVRLLLESVGPEERQPRKR